MNKYSQINILAWTLIITIPFILQSTRVINTVQYVTSKDNGWWSILTGPLLHGNANHFAGNIIGLLIGVTLLINLYKKSYWMVIVAGYICPAIVMYQTGFKSVGISGLVFTIVWFIIYRGLISTKLFRLIPAIVMLLLYGTTLYSAFPQTGSQIAWQAHLTGVLIGVFLAIINKISR